MSTVSGVSNGSADFSSASSIKDVSMGKQDFLMLLVAQLENQDPMNPSDPTEFTAQLAQFGQLEQLTNANKSLEGLNSMSTEMQRMSALGLVGQDVIAQTDQFHFDGQPIEIGYRTEMPAEEITLYVLNQNGGTLATIKATETEAGEYFINWDGMSDLDMPLEAGDYSLAIRAVDGDDALVDVVPLVKGKVQAVDLSSAISELETTAGVFSMRDVEKAGSSL
jgi:flagellar basal-body rod modification protein FlgD